MAPGVTVWEGPNRTGQKKTLKNGRNYHKNGDFRNDAISSYSLSENCSADFYQHDKGKGGFVIREKGPVFTDLGAGKSDQISTVYVTCTPVSSFQGVTVWEDSNLGGKKRELRDGRRYHKNGDFKNDAMSSF